MGLQGLCERGTIMEKSSELEQLYFRICEAQSNGDGLFFEQCFSQKDGVLAIGTDPEEWWVGHAAIARVFKAQLKEIEGIQIKAGMPQAYYDGSIGWIAGRPTYTLPNGTEIPARFTAVLQREEGGWKIVQWHSSIGISNEDVTGERLTTR